MATAADLRMCAFCGEWVNDVLGHTCYPIEPIIVTRCIPCGVELVEKGMVAKLEVRVKELEEEIVIWRQRHNEAMDRIIDLERILEGSME